MRLINNNERVKYAFHIGNWEEIKKELALVYFSDILGANDINIMWNKFCDISK